MTGFPFDGWSTSIDRYPFDRHKVGHPYDLQIYNASKGTPPMTKHTSIYLDSASRRQPGFLSTGIPSGQAATKFGLAVDQRGSTLWRSKG